MSNPPDGNAISGAGEPAGQNATIKLRLTHPHPLVSRTTYKTDTRDRAGHSLPNDYEGIDVRVSRDKFRVSLAAMDRLLKAVEQRGLQVRVDRDYKSRGTYVYSGHYDKCQVYLEEEHRRVEHVATAKEKADQARYGIRSTQKWDYLPTGKLILYPGGTVDLTSQQAFDDLIQRAIAGITTTIERAKEARMVREEAARRESDRQRKVEEEKKRTEALCKSADALHQYRLLLEYIEEVRRFGRVPSDQLRDGQTMQEWLQWALAHAKAIHPLGG